MFDKRKLYRSLLGYQIIVNFLLITTFKLVSDERKLSLVKFIKKNTKKKIINRAIKYAISRDEIFFEYMDDFFYRASLIYLSSTIITQRDFNYKFFHEEFSSSLVRKKYLELVIYNSNFVSENLSWLTDVENQDLLSHINKKSLFVLDYYRGDYRTVIDSRKVTSKYYYLSQLHIDSLTEFEFSNIERCKDISEVIALIRKQMITISFEEKLITEIYRKIKNSFKRKISKKEKLELQLLELQISISIGNSSSLYVMTKSESKYNIRSILPALNHIIVLCQDKDENRLEIEDYFHELCYLYSCGKLRFKFVRFVAYVSTLLTKHELATLIKRSCIDIQTLKLDAENNSLAMVLSLILSDTKDALKIADELTVYGTKNIFTDTEVVEGRKNLYYFPIKTILYQYLFSIQYQNFDENDYVICDSRFHEIFESNFPNCNFIPVERPNLHPNLSNKEAGMRAVEWYLPKGFDFSDYNCIPLSLDIDKHTDKRTSGWLEVPEKDFPVVSSGKINIGISVATGRQSKHRNMYSLPYSAVKDIFDDVDNVKLINLDYHVDDHTLLENNISSPNIDLKNDISSYLSLINSLHFIIIIPNSNMDAAASVNTKAFVFDPFGRGTYWTYGKSNEYISSSAVEFVWGETYSSTLESLKNRVRAELGKLSLKQGSVEKKL